MNAMPWVYWLQFRAVDKFLAKGIIVDYKLNLL